MGACPPGLAAWSASARVSILSGHPGSVLCPPLSAHPTHRYLFGVELTLTDAVPCVTVDRAGGRELVTVHDSGVCADRQSPVQHFGI